MRVYTVSNGRPFLAVLAEAMLAGDLPAPGRGRPSPIDLAGMTLLLPTRRAIRALQEAFLTASGGEALLLPRIKPLSAGEEELGLISAAAGLPPFSGDGLPPTVSEMERRLALTKLVLAWSGAVRAGSPDAAMAAGTPAQAVHLAVELAGLLDSAEGHGGSLEGLAGLAPDELSEHWRKTLEFLAIATKYWPLHLAESGRLSPADRRNRVLRMEAERLAARPAPVIAAGGTGGTPAAIELMRVVACLPEGALVLAGLDRDLDEASWQTIVPDHPGHPQFGLKKLLDTLGLCRADVVELPGAGLAPSSSSRNRLLSETMRPSATTDRWHAYVGGEDRAELRTALDGIDLIEAPTSEDEAEVIALILREAVETPGRTAALVTPDRQLARRVAVRLESRGIRVDDSAGRPFVKTPPGAFLILVAEALAGEVDPTKLLSLLKHPLARLGLDHGQARRSARALELAVFRRPHLSTGIAEMVAALDRARAESASGERRHPAIRRLGEPDWQAARDIVTRLVEATAAMQDVSARNAPTALRDLASAHLSAAGALARPSEPDVAAQLWSGAAGDAARSLFVSLLDESMPLLEMMPCDYPGFFRALVAREMVRPEFPAHPRVAIWGPLESRLMRPDVVVLGGLNEGTWPAVADPGPWLNRPMRARLGLPSPEERIGLAAHDFATAFGARQVHLTRAAKVDGAPTVPSRWLLRLRALLDGAGLGDALSPAKTWLAWAAERDRVGEHRPVRAPEPRPPVALRPRRLRVTRVERWLANPYSIFAEYILGLLPLDPIGGEPGLAFKGTVIHAALGRFAAQHPTGPPDDIAGVLMGHVRDVVGDDAAHARVKAFWLPRFQRFADWFAATERERRKGVAEVLAEVSGARVIEAPAGPFTLTARADRIDRLGDGLVITDYKTGKPPSRADVESGKAPQLPLEAAIAIAGKFSGLAAARVERLAYIRVTGGEPPGEANEIAIDIAETARAALAGLTRLVAQYDRADTPYRAVRRPLFAKNYRFDAYAHLARVAEWSAAEDDEEGAS